MRAPSYRRVFDQLLLPYQFSRREQVGEGRGLDWVRVRDDIEEVVSLAFRSPSSTDVQVYTRDLAAQQALQPFGKVWLPSTVGHPASWAGIAERWSNDPNGPIELAEAVKIYGLHYFDWIHPLEVRAEVDGRGVVDKRVLTRHSRERLAATLYRMGRLEEGREVLRATTKPELPSKTLDALMRLYGLEPLTAQTATERAPNVPPGMKAEDALDQNWRAQRRAQKEASAALGSRLAETVYERPRRGQLEVRLEWPHIILTDVQSREILGRILPEGSYLKSFTLRARMADPSQDPQPWIWQRQSTEEFHRLLEEKVLPFLDRMEDVSQLADRLGRHRGVWDNPSERFYLAMTLHRMGLSQEASAVLDNAPTDIPRPMLKNQIAALRGYFAQSPP